MAHGSWDPRGLLPIRSVIEGNTCEFCSLIISVGQPIVCCQRYGWVHAYCCRNKIQEGATIRLIRQFHEGPHRVYHFEENHGKLALTDGTVGDCSASANKIRHASASSSDPKPTIDLQAFLEPLSDK